jgi:hypothetical protein
MCCRVSNHTVLCSADVMRGGCDRGFSILYNPGHSFLQGALDALGASLSRLAAQTPSTRIPSVIVCRLPILVVLIRNAGHEL